MAKNKSTQKFICEKDQCGKKFLDKSKLKRHQLVHSVISKGRTRLQVRNLRQKVLSGFQLADAHSNAHRSQTVPVQLRGFFQKTAENDSLSPAIWLPMKNRTPKTGKVWAKVDFFWEMTWSWKSKTMSTSWKSRSRSKKTKRNCQKLITSTNWNITNSFYLLPNAKQESHKNYKWLFFINSNLTKIVRINF